MASVNNWKNAASVILISRKTQRILMMRRGAGAKFMPNAVVFPGGVVASSDADLGCPTRIAALREIFEETGLLITNSGIQSAADCADLKDAQKRVKNNAELFSKINTAPNVDALVEWNTWLTPTTHSRRYMTTFYVLPIDGEPNIEMCTDEMAHYCWEAPDVCLGKAFTGELALPPPQVYELTRLSQMSVDEIPTMGNTTRLICPQQVRWADQSRISNIFPGDHLYIEENDVHQPGRTLSLEQVTVDKMMPTHRAVFSRQPLWAACEVYQHELQSPYDVTFKKFRTHSSSLL